MKKKIFSCKSVIHRSIPLNNLNYYNLIISGQAEMPVHEFLEKC